MAAAASNTQKVTSPFEAFKYGVTESLECLKDGAKVIVFTTAFTAGTCYLFREGEEVQGVWIPTMLTSAAFGRLSLFKLPEEVTGISPKSISSACRMIGNNITALTAGPLTLLAIERFFF